LFLLQQLLQLSHNLPLGTCSFAESWTCDFFHYKTISPVWHDERTFISLSFVTFIIPFPRFLHRSVVFYIWIFSAVLIPFIFVILVVVILGVGRKSLTEIYQRLVKGIHGVLNVRNSSHRLIL
jgi:hypothetical protein